MRAICCVFPMLAVCAWAAASQFGSPIVKRTIPAVFVLKREGGAWRISVMRIAGRGY